MPNDDLYAVLKVDPRASTSEIRKAYLSLARETHPDRGAETASFQTLLHAYEVLSDPARRAAYDAELGSRSRSHARRRAPPSTEFDDPFIFPPMPQFPSFFSMDPFGMHSRSRGSRFGAAPNAVFGDDLFVAGFPFGFMGGRGGFPFEARAMPFGPGFMFDEPLFSSSSRRSQRPYDPFDGMFDDVMFEEARASTPATAEQASRTRPAGREVVESNTQNEVQGSTLERRMKEQYEHLQSRHPPTSSNEYVIRDANGNPCGWGYSATWTSSSGR